MSVRRRLGGLMIAAVVSSVTSCGIRADNHFRDVDPAGAPFVLDTTSPTDPPRSNVEVTVPEAVYLIDADTRLVRHPVPRSADVMALVELLSRTADTAGVQLRSALPVNSIVSVVASTATMLTVELSPAFLEMPSDEQGLAIAQIVLTLTDPSPDATVSFSVSGSVIDVPRADSSIANGAVDRGDYAAEISSGTVAGS